MQQNELSPLKIEEILKNKGIRPTSHRVSIARYILRSHRHFTAQEIYTWGVKRMLKVSVATVYNTLNELADAGLIKAVQVSEGDETIYDSNVAPHFHFFDSQTREIIDIDPAQVKISLDSLSGYDIEDVDIVIRGRRTINT